ncbi:hypothetical protein Amsp01_040790 [Amycolatopsis sp. NBRC 101858]|uniref:hypothetical protein n=1 Tax=Amycolatopsis sp. NBRC 101858 TaxID=3032200 RepID=UPI0024A1DBE8|nr:hypothetical protein [Amycolatopsis sp. NBRC 101858]GLY38055.1 hypothetical protein Amsp01_040790 [Amycolatopsis sp. NBRC 101858]
MRLHRLAAGISLAIALVLPGGTATAAPVRTVGVGGEVVNPARYTAAELVALGQATYPVANPRPGAPAVVTGTSLYDVVVRAVPVVPPGKNTALRVLVRVTGAHGRVTFALGELDPGFGNHPAVLVPGPRGIGLVVPGDRDRSRSVGDVRAVDVTVSTAGVQDVPEGAVRIVTAHRAVTLPGWLLARLPARTVHVTFQAGTTPQTHVETGPALSSVLLAAGVLPLPGTPVVAVGADGYGAAVTLAEDYVGGRPLLLSTAEDGVALARPRLVPDGDVKGGRYVSGVVTLGIG